MLGTVLDRVLNPDHLQRPLAGPLERGEEADQRRRRQLAAARAARTEAKQTIGSSAKEFESPEPRTVDKVIMFIDTIRIVGGRGALGRRLVSDKPPLPRGKVPICDRGWCGREDSNFHVLSDTATSRLRVYQFRHDRT